MHVPRIFYECRDRFLPDATGSLLQRHGSWRIYYISTGSSMLSVDRWQNLSMLENLIVMQISRVDNNGKRLKEKKW